MKIRLLKTSTIVIIGGLIVYGVLYSFIKIKQFQKETSSPTLKKVVENALTGTKGTYGIVIKNLKTGESYSLNKDRVFESGSLYKIWILATVFDQIEKGELKEDEVLSQNIETLNKKFSIATEDAEMTEGEITLPVTSAAKQMITISHNYAALLLSERIKLAAVKAFLQEHNLNQSSLGDPPKTTPYDVALFFEKLYKEELARSENTKKMLDIFKMQQLNDGLPKYLPDNVEIAHKTGDIGWFKHDAGIVFLNNSDYIIVVMSESNSPSGAQERIAQISKAVYEYFKFVILKSNDTQDK